MTAEKGRDVIESGWRAMLDLNLRNPNEEILAACELSAELLELHIDRKDMITSDISDSEWEDSDIQ